MKKPSPFRAVEPSEEKVYRWTTINYLRPETLPQANVPVIVCDCTGNFGICIIDPSSGDFFLTLGGYEVEELISAIMGTVIGKSLAGKFKEADIDRIFFQVIEQFGATCRVEFCGPVAWMPVPPPPPEIEEADEHTVGMIAFDVLNDLESAVRQAVMRALDAHKTREEVTQ